ncbi:MAG: O-methyltransferase [Anaerolineales bacterium]|nr:O-methyltransferase [Anaerolineales bacterium]
MPTYDDNLEGYLRDLFAIEDDVLKIIRENIVVSGLPQMTIKPEEGRFLEFIVAASGVHLALEIGTLGGYSGTWIVRGLPDEGRLITIEEDPERAAVAEGNFRLAGFAERVDIRVGDAHQLLPELSTEGPFGFVFIDAEKEGYPAYLDWALENLRPGGVVAGHNAFGRGGVANEADTSARIEALRTFNRRLAEDPQMVSLIFPAGDGTAFAVRKK